MVGWSSLKPACKHQLKPVSSCFCLVFFTAGTYVSGVFNMLCKVIFKRAIIYTIKYVKCEKLLKGSYDVAKKNIILCILCNAILVRGSKNTLFSTYCYFCSSMPGLSETGWFVHVLRSKVCTNWPAISALWLAEYLKRVTEMLHPFPHCDAVSRHQDTIKQ